ncbi:MAG TPA: site-2 protease family protein [Verrucomicrobiae bacterium]
MATSGTFSESWYRIADQRAALRPHVQVRRQYYRGELWYVLQDPINNQFFRLRAAAYDFIGRLSLDKPIGKAWEECLAKHPDDAPGQEDVVRLLAQLYQANLLHSDLPPDSAQLFERFRKRREREVQSRLLGIMFARIPLLDPDAFLKRCLPLARLLISPVGGLIWLLVVGWGLKVALDNFAAIQRQSESVLAPDNLFLLYLGFVLVKTIHELGHAFMCRRFGGEVHAMGIMFMIFTPVPYVDATSSWAFRSRWQRILVGAGGMIPELFLAAIMTVVWANTGEGVLHSLAYNMLFVASVSTILFNANPLMRFDGYYILSDLLDIPNLYTRANQQLGFLIERFAFGRKQAESPAHGRREAWWLTVYGLAGHVYRVIVFGTILFFLGKRLLILGVIMAVVCFIGWVIVPLVKLAQYLAGSPRLERCRPRAIGVCATALAGLLVVLEIVPFPSHFRAPGVLQASEHTIVVSETPGNVESLLAQPGDRVVRGQALVQLRDRDLDSAIAATRAQLDEAAAQELRALRQQAADLKPLRSRQEAIAKQLRKLEAQQEALTVRARHEGVWVSPELRNLRGAWLARGTPLGLVINPEGWQFSAVVSQSEASRLFASEIRGAKVRLHGQAGVELPVASQKIIPAEHQTLPSAALGWRGGGEVAVALDDPSGTRAAEPFFELRAIMGDVSTAAILHGRSGKVRFDLPAEPLLHQWLRKLRQLLQKQYAL